MKEEMAKEKKHIPWVTVEFGEPERMQEIATWKEESKKVWVL